MGSVHENLQDCITELHYANLYLGNLEFEAKETWRPKALIIKPTEEPRASKPK